MTEKVFELDKSRILRQIEPLLYDNEFDDAQVLDLFARAAFSCITEPGDRFAGWLLTTFGATRSLTAVLDGFAFHELVNQEQQEELHGLFGDPSSTFGDARARWKERVQLSHLEAALSAAARAGSRLISPANLQWPKQFKGLELGQPHCLWVKGDPRLLSLSARSLAIVGSRLATSYGELVTSDIVSLAVPENIAVISGGAYGIDSIAHRATLALDGFTIAVMAGGIDRLYPAGNIDLLQEIGRDNLLVSEQAPGSSPTKWRFLQRNRLIAALGSATVVVEAGHRSGALNTARHALSVGRPVGAVPGRLDSPESAGCHQLIRNHSNAEQQVHLVDSPKTALELVVGPSPLVLSHDAPESGPLEIRAFDALTSRTQSVAELSFKSGLSAGELQYALGVMELDGRVANRNGGWVRLPPKPTPTSGSPTG